MLTGTGGLTKLGTGTLVINEANNYTGGTVVANGTLQLGTNDNLLPTGTTLTLGDGTANTSGILDLNGNAQLWQGCSRRARAAATRSSIAPAGP